MSRGHRYISSIGKYSNDGVMLVENGNHELMNTNNLNLLTDLVLFPVTLFLFLHNIGELKKGRKKHKKGLLFKQQKIKIDKQF